jgi:hypothetical protein
MIVLVDFSQTVISACAANAKDIQEGDTKNFIKHIALNMLLGWKKKFGGKFILACDSNEYWRRDEYPAYKGHRKHKKKDGFLDWELVYETVNELKQELHENFPYLVLEVKGAEADDIIAILVKYFDENELAHTGLIEEPDEIVIVSTDNDFQQLQKYRNVRQWNNTKGGFIKCVNPKQFLIEHIAQGDDGDNVPNICTPDAWSQMRADNITTRAAPFATARFKEFYNKGIDACKNEEELLLDFDKIPERINNLVVKEYLDSMNNKKLGNKARVFSYLVKHQMRMLLPSAADF